MTNLISLSPSDYDELYYEYHKTRAKNSPKIILNPERYMNFERKNSSAPKNEIAQTEGRKPPKYLPKLNYCFHSNQVTLESLENFENLEEKKIIFPSHLMIPKKIENNSKVKNKPKLKPLSIKKEILKEKNFKINGNIIKFNSNSKSNRSKKIIINLNMDKKKKANELRKKIINKAYEKEKQEFKSYCVNNNEAVVNELVVEFFRRTNNNKMSLGERGKVMTDMHEPKYNEQIYSRNLNRKNYKQIYKSSAILPNVNKNRKESEKSINTEIINKKKKKENKELIVHNVFFEWIIDNVIERYIDKINPINKNAIEKFIRKIFVNEVYNLSEILFQIKNMVDNNINEYELFNDDQRIKNINSLKVFKQRFSPQGRKKIIKKNKSSCHEVFLCDSDFDEQKEQEKIKRNIIKKIIEKISKENNDIDLFNIENEDYTPNNIYNSNRINKSTDIKRNMRKYISKSSLTQENTVNTSNNEILIKHLINIENAKKHNFKKK